MVGSIGIVIITMDVEHQMIPDKSCVGLILQDLKGDLKMRLINMVKSKREKGIDTGHDDYSISPAIRQSLQHWAYQLTEEDCK